MKTFSEWLHDEGLYTPQELKMKGETITDKDREEYQALYEEKYFQYLIEEIRWTPFKDIVINRFKKKIPLIEKAGRIA